MALQVQLDFFESEEQSEIKALELLVNDVRMSNDRVRKKLFAENGDLKKRMIELEDRLSILERNICKKE